MVRSDVRALTIGELERESGVRRRTIYYYVHHGLLPEAQKASPSRALYTEDHLVLLNEIEQMRHEGMRRAAIKMRLEGRIRAAGANGVDLVARREQETRQAILAAATRSFALNGFKGTRMADLVEDLGITPQVLYGHFPTKRELFVACYSVAIQYMDSILRPRFRETDDAAERQVWYMYADSGIKAFAPDMFSLAVEAATRGDTDARRDLLEALNALSKDTIADFRGMRRAAEEPPLSDELLSHALIGAFEHMQTYASLDDRFSWRDLVRTNVAIFLALRAAYVGELDLRSSLASYEDLIDRVASLPPPVPDQLRP